MKGGVAGHGRGGWEHGMGDGRHGRTLQVEMRRVWTLVKGGVSGSGRGPPLMIRLHHLLPVYLR